MNVITTGGSGLIGRQLTALLVQKGYHVTILSRKAVKNPEKSGMQTC